MEHPAPDLDAEPPLATAAPLDLTEPATESAGRRQGADILMDAFGATTPPLLDLALAGGDPDRTGELVIDEDVLEQIRTSHHPSAGRRIGGQCDPTVSRFASYSECPHCGGAMAAEHAHFRCGSCGWRDSCCD